MMNRRSMLRAAAAVAILPLAAACAPSSKRQSAGEYIDDASITTRVKAKLAEDRDVRARDVNVETYQGVVQLSGFVGTAAESRRAEALTREVKGVKSIRNDIRIKSNN